MKKPVISLLLALALVFCTVMIAVPALAANTEHEDHCVCGKVKLGDEAAAKHGTCVPITGWKPIANATELTEAVTTAGNYYLTENITLTKELATGNVKINLCLNGHFISGNNTVRTITNNGTLNITDCQGGGQIKNGKSGYGGGNIANKGILNLYAGEIVNGTAGNGGNIHNTSSGTFTMYGGTIQGGKANATMSSGTYRNYGGNIYHEAGNITICGGLLDGGTALVGGNIGTLKPAQLTIAGGTISGGEATGLGSKDGKPGHGNTLYIMDTTTTTEGVALVNFTGGTIIAGTAEGSVIEYGSSTSGKVYSARATLALKITKMGLQIKGTETEEAGNVGVGYTSQIVVTSNDETHGGFRFNPSDSTSIGYAYGLKLYLEGYESNVQYRGYTVADNMFAADGTANTYKTHLDGILKTNKSPEDNTLSATANVCGAAYIVIGGTVVESQKTQFTLKNLVESMDIALKNDSAAMELLKDLYSVYVDVMGTWKLDNTLDNTNAA